MAFRRSVEREDVHGGEDVARDVGAWLVGVEATDGAVDRADVGVVLVEGAGDGVGASVEAGDGAGLDDFGDEDVGAGEPVRGSGSKKAVECAALCAELAFDGCGTVLVAQVDQDHGDFACGAFERGEEGFAVHVGGAAGAGCDVFPGVLQPDEICALQVDGA